MAVETSFGPAQDAVATSGWRGRLAGVLRRVAARLVRVTVASVGKADDGLIAVARGGGPLDRSWPELSEQFTDVLEAWRKNPLARRIIGLTTSYVVGDGITLTAAYGPLKRYLALWWSDAQNLLDLRLGPWSDELARAGELFVALHCNRADGLSYVRLVPASAIDRITWRAGDYEAEESYHEVVAYGDPDYDQGGRVWYAPAAPDADVPRGDGGYAPVMLHFAVNRPAGCVRGDSDLATILPWLKRYGRWLEDRVRLNAAVRAFLWIVKVPKQNIALRQAELRTPPEAGSVQVIDKDSEEWQAVAPILHANDAQADGRAIRWMVVAGGPGIGLTDLGESETANLASATAMGEQRTRFLKARQSYFGYLLARCGLESYNRAVRLGLVRGRLAQLRAVRIGFSDVSSADNVALAQSAASVANALNTVFAMGVNGSAFKRLALRLMLRFAGEQVGEQDLDVLLADVVAVEVEAPSTVAPVAPAAPERPAPAKEQ